MMMKIVSPAGIRMCNPGTWVGQKANPSHQFQLRKIQFKELLSNHL